MDNNNSNVDEKDIYKLFNYVKLKENQSDKFDKEVTNEQKRRIKNNFKKKIKCHENFKVFKYASIAAAVSLITIIGAGTYSPAFAKNVPVLNSIIQKLSEKFGQSGEYEKYAQIINKPVTYNGVTLTINEVIADDSKLVLGYTIKSNKAIKDLEVFGLSRFMMINGKNFGSYGGGTGSYLDSHTYIGSEEINTDIMNQYDNFKINLNVDEIGNINGKWNFAFAASKSELVKKSLVFTPNLKVNLPGSKVNVNKVIFSPIDTRILINGEGTNKNISKKSRREIFDYDYWIAFNDKGVELIPKGLGGGELNLNTRTFSSVMQYEKTKSIPKYLTIVPCKITLSEGGGVSGNGNTGKETPISVETKKPKKISKILDGVYPMELSQGKMGKITIKEIKTEKNKTIVKYTAEGKAPYFQSQSLWIDNSNGKQVDFLNYNIRKDNSKPNEFTREFKALKSNEKYTIYTDDFSNVEFRDDLKFKINLSK